MAMTLSPTLNRPVSPVRRVALIAAVVAALALSATAGFWVGFLEGWNLALMAESTRIAYVAVPRLVAVESGRTAELTRAFELDVDNGLIWAHHFMESPLHDYLEPIWGINGYPNDMEQLKKLATYRRTHPSPTKLNSFDDVQPQIGEDGGFEKSLAASLQERALIVNEMVTRYAAKSKP